MNGRPAASWAIVAVRYLRVVNEMVEEL